MRKSLLAGVAVVALSLSSAAQAAVTYEYVGKAFTQGVNSGLGDHVTGVFTFDNTVGSNYTAPLKSYSNRILSFSLSSGPVTASTSSGTGFLALAMFEFDNGKITNWLVDAYPPTPRSYIFTGYVAARNIVYDYVALGNASSSNLYSYTPGTWTQTPLPATLPLFGSVMLGLGALARRHAKLAAA